MRTWIDENRDSNVTTKEFIRLSESVSGREPDGFFHRWPYEKKVPKLPKSSGRESARTAFRRSATGNSTLFRRREDRVVHGLAPVA